MLHPLEQPTKQNVEINIDEKAKEFIRLGKRSIKQ